MGDAGIDFVLAVYHEADEWRVEPLPEELAGDLDGLVDVLRRRPAAHGGLGLISVDDDFFVAVRVFDDDVRYLLSDVTAASDWPLARVVLQRLGLPMPEEEEQVQPAGDLGIFADFGVPSMTVAAVCDEIDWYPEDMIGELADQMGFTQEYEAALDVAEE
ncbi:MAG: tRNA adenosine deaminase-associated protein [Jiangellaceae bacterium]